MKQFLITFIAVLSGLVVFILVLPLAGLLMTTSSDIEAPETMILSLNLNQAIPEAPTQDLFAKVVGQPALSVPEIISVLRRSAHDNRVKGIHIKLGAAGIRIAQAQEIRDAIKVFRDAGKFAIAYAQQFLSGGLGAYYTASACDEIWLQTTGESHVSGISISTPFIKETLNKIGITPQLGRRHEYKTAANIFTQNELTDAHRQSLEHLIGSTFNNITSDIAKDRDWLQKDFIDLVDSAPHTAEEALKKRLVDRLGYEDEVRESIHKRTNSEIKFVAARDYLDRVGGNYEEGRTIALIYGTGTIVSGNSNDRNGSLSQSDTMGSDTISQAFRDAADDPDVEAIVFRVSSPGGSYLASDQIWREVRRAREAGKPVVATMGATAASGGYFVAMAADKVLAQAGTITGSIGVLGGKMVTADLLSKLGVALGEVSVGKNALIGSSLRGYTPEQWKWINRSLDRVYEDFTRKAAEARGLGAEQIDSAARGRIWTGYDAVQIGLVDKVGGFVDAIDQAKDLAGIDSSTPVQLRQFPKSITLSEQLLRLVGGLDGVEEAAAFVISVARNPQIRATFAPLGHTSSGALTMPPIYQLP